MRRGEYDNFDSHDLQRAFEKYGTLLRATITLDRETGVSKGFGFVSFSTAEEADTAMQVGEVGHAHATRVSEQGRE